MNRFILILSVMVALDVQGYSMVGLSSTRFASRIRSSQLQMGLVMPSGAAPGNPVVKNVDSEKNIAYMSVALGGEQTQKAFSKACDMFNEEVKTRGYKVAGFRQGAKLPPLYLYQMFGEDQVKALCGTLMTEDIQDECEKTGLRFVGRGRIISFNEKDFVAGETHTIDIECDLWPQITYEGENGYKGLKISVNKVSFNVERFDQVKKSIQEKYKILTPTPLGYAAMMGDVVVGNMQGYEKNDDGSKGSSLPAVASGDGVEITLEKGKFMEGLVEGLEGTQAGETRAVAVKFPVRPTGPGAALSGKECIFEIEVSAIKTKSLPPWDEELAGRVREGLTLELLEKEIIQAIDEEGGNTKEIARNAALADALVAITTFSTIPESLVEENTQSKFQNMLADFKEQGSSEEQLQEMMAPEKYQKYKDISRPNVEKIVKLGMLFREIAEKESIAVTPEEVRQQLDLIVAQAKQKNEAPPDQRRAAEEIENVLLRKKVFEFLASHAEITWVEPPTATATA